MSLSNKSAQQLQDLRRVLLGLALALQHTASHEAKQLTQHAHIFHHSNKHAFSAAQHYADAAVNTAKHLAAASFASPLSKWPQSRTAATSSSPYTAAPTSYSSAAASSLSAALPSAMDVVSGVSKVIGTVQSAAHNATRSTSTPSPLAHTASALPSGADIAMGVAKVIGVVQSINASGRSPPTSSPASTAPYPSSSSSSSMLPSGADIVSNVAKVIGAVQSPLSAVSTLSSAGATAASNMLPLLSSLPLPQMAAAMVSSALPPGVPRPSAEQVNAAVNAVLAFAQQAAQQLSQQTAAPASPATTVQRPASADNLSPYPPTAGMAAADPFATIQPPSFLNTAQTTTPAPASPTTISSSSSRSTAPPHVGSAASTGSAFPGSSVKFDSYSSSSKLSSPDFPSPAAGQVVPPSTTDAPQPPPSFTSPTSAPTASSAASFDLPPPAFLSQPDSSGPSTSSSTTSTRPPASSTSSSASESNPLPFDPPPPAFLSQPTPTANSTTSPSSSPTPPSPTPAPSAASPTARPVELRSRAVPSTPIGRVFGFGGIAMRMLTGTVVDATKRIWGGDDTANIASTLTPAASHSLSADAPNSSSSAAATPSAVSRFLSPANTERLAEGLCRMRGAALKIGQMLSIQDDALLPPSLAAVLARVRDSADMMPEHQLRSVLSTEWGDDWQTKLDRFDEQPIAAASIGQVHRGSVRGVGEVVVKVQYPGVADSIESDVENVRRLINWFNVVPKGLYLDKTMDAAKEELGAECDYQIEAANQTQFRQLLRSSPLHPRVSVPGVVEQLCTRQVLVSEWVAGVPIDRLTDLPQVERDRICRDLVQLCLLELFVWRFMQTDPNWSNFLYDTAGSSSSGGTLHLVDFGACRTYSKSFIDDYLRMVYACAERDRPAVIEYSRRLGFITGEESREMLNAHVAAALIIGEPFSSQYATSGYGFAAMNMSGRVSELARVMVRLRLTAPPKESYTLHRKLSGCFLTCKKLHANVSLRDMFMDVYRQYQFD